MLLLISMKEICINKEELGKIKNSMEIFEKGIQKFVPKLRNLEQDLIYQKSTLINFNLKNQKGFENYDTFLGEVDLDHHLEFDKIKLKNDNSIVSYKGGDRVYLTALPLIPSFISLLTYSTISLDVRYHETLYNSPFLLFPILSMVGVLYSHFKVNRDINIFSKYANDLEKTLKYRKHLLCEISEVLK